MNYRLPRLTPAQANAASHVRGSGHRVLLLLALLLVWLPGYGLAGDADQTEYRIKAAFLYNFARFVKWPDIPTGHFTLCVLGTDPLGEQLDEFMNKMVHERPLRVMHLNSLALVDDCQMVFIGRSDTHRLHEFISLLREQPVLTVSDIENFIENGGIIGLRLIDNKVRFDVNIDAADTAGLSISSKLLTLATKIRPVE